MKKKVKEKSNTLKTILLSFVFTMFCVYFIWTILYFLDESDYLTLDIRTDISLGVSLILMLGIVITFLIKQNRFIKSFNLNENIFDLVSVPIWCLSNAYLSSFFMLLVKTEAIHHCDVNDVDLIFGTCYLNGIEYELLGKISIFVGITYAIIKLIKLLIKNIKSVNF